MSGNVMDKHLLDDIQEIVVVNNDGPMSAAEAKMKLGEVACALVYDEGFNPDDARESMIEFPGLRPLFEKAGYIKNGVIGYTVPTLERWARRYNEHRLQGDKRRIGATIYGHQLAMHLQLQQRLHRAVMNGDLHHAHRYAQVSELIGKMVPGLFVSDPSSINFTNITVTEGQKTHLVAIMKTAEEKVRAIEQRIIEGEVVDSP